MVLAYPAPVGCWFLVIRTSSRVSDNYHDDDERPHCKGDELGDDDGVHALTPPYDDKSVKRNDQGGDSDPGFSQLLYDTLSGAERARFDLPLVYPFNVEDGTKGLYEIRKK